VEGTLLGGVGEDKGGRLRKVKNARRIGEEAERERLGAAARKGGVRKKDEEGAE